eukprot:gene22572-biopygen31241
MTGHRDLLEDIRDVLPMTIQTASGTTTVTQVGTATIMGDKGTTHKLRNVHLNTDPTTPNLFSMATAIKASPTMKVEFDSDRCIMTINNKSLLTVPKKRNLCLVPTIRPDCTIIQGSSRDIAMAAIPRIAAQTAELYHTRLGHLDYSSLARMASEGMVIGMDTKASAFNKMKKKTCEICVLSKMDKNTYPTSHTCATRLMAILHIDMSGIMKIPSLNGSLYFQGILNDHSKHSIVTFHKTKDTVAKDTIIELERYEVMTENKIGKIFCDNGSEYTCNKFTNWCKKKGITLQFTVPVKPSTNGAAERLNRTLHDRSTALLLSSKFPNRYWAEMVKNASVQKPSPTSESDKTPYEMFHGVKPKIDHLRTIGCTAYVHIPPKTRAWKFSPSVKITRLIGYSEKRKAYRVVDSDHKIFDDRDITFNEFENLAGKDGFPGPDAVVLGIHEEDTPLEPDEDNDPTVLLLKELEDMEEHQARLLRHREAPPNWGSPSEHDISHTPSTIQQASFLP